MRILVVDDDPSMRNLITTYLTDQGIMAHGAASRQEGQEALLSQHFSLIVLDLRLGRDDGLDLLRHIRAEFRQVPVIIITGHRRDEVDRVVGLELGADDYLTKPFGMRELLARIRAVLRRQQQVAPATTRGPAPERFLFGGWVLDQGSRTLTDPAGLITELTRGEYALLVAFLSAPRRPLSREHLLQATRIHEDVYDRSIDVKILRLRRRLGDTSGEHRIIQTRRGMGYVFTLPVTRG